MALAKSLAVLSLTIPLLCACGGSNDSPANPSPPAYTLLGTLDGYGDGSIAPVTASGPTLVAAMGNGLSIIDVSDPHQPSVLGRIDQYGTDPNSPDTFVQIAVNGNTLAAAVVPGCSGFCSFDPDGGEIRIHDISDPTNPARIATLSEGASDLLIDGRYLYALRHQFSFGTAFSAGRLDVIDLTDPANPTPVGQVAVSVAARLQKSGDRVYIAGSDVDGSGRFLDVVDVSDPSAPVVLATNGSPSTASARGSLAIVSGMAYFADPVRAVYVTGVSAAAMPLGSGTAVTGVSADCIAATATDLLVCAGGNELALMRPAGNDLSFVRSIPASGQPDLVRVFDKLGVFATSPVFGTDGLGNPVLTTPARLALFVTD